MNRPKGAHEYDWEQIQMNNTIESKQLMNN